VLRVGVDGVDREALTVAMAVAPGVYARNRMFGFFKDPEVRRAKQRAAVLRGVIRQLTGTHGEVDELSLSRSAHGPAILKYRISSVHLARSMELTEIEAACVAYLGARAGVAGLHATEEDRVVIDGTLRKLAAGLALRVIEAGHAG
jgi:hypothetical protein